jgi:hypothetical protein
MVAMACFVLMSPAEAEERCASSAGHGQSPEPAGAVAHVSELAQTLLIGAEIAADAAVEVIF